MVEKVSEVLKKADDDDQIKALLLKINSPGGTVTSSDIIYHEIKSFKKKKGIPVYALFMDLAGIGGQIFFKVAESYFVSIHPKGIKIYFVLWVLIGSSHPLRTAHEKFSRRDEGHTQRVIFRT